jgi:hypothetical protein
MRLLRGASFVIAGILAVLAGLGLGVIWSGRTWQDVVGSVSRIALPTPATQVPLKNRYQITAEIDQGADGFEALSRDILGILTRSGFCGGAACFWADFGVNHPDGANYAPGEYVAVKFAKLGDKRFPKADFRVEQVETSAARLFLLQFHIETDDPVLVTREAFLPALAERFGFDPKQVRETCRAPSLEPILNRAKDKRFLCFLRPAQYFEGGKLFEKERYLMRFDSAARCGRLTGKPCPGGGPVPR